jgi:hypothetical protein
MSSGNGQQRYVVSIPSGVKARFRPWAESAVRLGLRAEYFADLRRLAEKLQYDPREWGDPIRTFYYARLQYFHARTEFFEVQYAVHLDRPLVFVRDITLRHDGPLGRAGDA